MNGIHVLKNIYDYTIRDYYQMYEKYVSKGYKGAFEDALKDMLGFALPEPLGVLDAPQQKLKKMPQPLNIFAPMLSKI